MNLFQVDWSGAPRPFPRKYTGSDSCFEIPGRHIGMGFGYTLHSITFDTAKINGQSSFSLAHHPAENFAVTDLTFAYRFK